MEELDGDGIERAPPAERQAVQVDLLDLVLETAVLLLRQDRYPPFAALGESCGPKGLGLLVGVFDVDEEGTRRLKSRMSQL